MTTERAANAIDGAVTVDAKNRDRLVVSAPLMREWSKQLCVSKPTGGMEEWVKTGGTEESVKAHESTATLSCDWYHGTWQFLRLLNMVAVPPWYEFYDRALGQVLREHPKANLLISAAADYGMLATLHDAIVASGASPTVTLYDICPTPLRATQWYAERYGLEVECVCDNILTSPRLPREMYDLIVTDEFLTVVKDPDKPMVVERWKEFLKPGGVVVTTAMVGGATTPRLRQGYAERARDRLGSHAELFSRGAPDHDELARLFDRFAAFHTRHMIRDEEQIRSLFGGFSTEFTLTSTPGECVNPTNSFQIKATKAG